MIHGIRGGSDLPGPGEPGSLTSYTAGGGPSQARLLEVKHGAGDRRLWRSTTKLVGKYLTEKTNAVAGQ